MPVFDECCVLIPASTLEDFPTDLSDHDARSLLAGWTVLWHPRLLAQSEQIPVWYRADSPPEPIGNRLVVAPAPSLPQLPAGYAIRATQIDGCLWAVGTDRAELLAALQLDQLPSLTSGDREVSIEDFFAVGFTSLQIQIMTRRLRYTSNLDEIHLQNRVVEAAKAFVDGDAEQTIKAIHDVFDCLAEERDHYFSSDPHLIDLTLVTSSTVDRLLEAWQAAPSSSGNSDSSVLSTPLNLLIDAEAVGPLVGRASSTAATLCDQLRSGDVGWAGGGPATDAHLDTMTFAQAQQMFRDVHQKLTNAIGASPPVYARFAGTTPSDMTATIAALGYAGMIPLDFAGGAGHDEEAKILIQTAGGEIEALTAKPIDASSDASFLALAARLGAAIDGGEIATGLLVHWPGQGCESYHDLRRVASWSVSLGRFWKLDEYFRDGEHPYHHGTTSAASADGWQTLSAAVETGSCNPISSVSVAFRQAVQCERDAMLVGMTRLVTGDPTEQPSDSGKAFARAVGADSADQSKSNHGSSILLVNPHSIGCRENVEIIGKIAAANHIFATSRQPTGTAATVDIPACGFVALRSGSNADGEQKSDGLGSWIGAKWLGKSTSIAEDGRLQNEFMEVSISRDTGGISGVYSGSIRGNRFSMRLVAVGVAGVSADQSVMRCKKIRVVKTSAAVGCIEASGEIINGDKKVLAEFSVAYTLRRGSRVIEVDGSVVPKVPHGDDPWQSYLAARVAVSGDSAICRLLLRDKVHRSSGRRLVAPLGLLVDEAERQTMISSGGRAFHRRVSDRFFDTLLSVKGESEQTFALQYGFDVPAPVALAKSLIAPSIRLPLENLGKIPSVGWILYPSPKEILLTNLRVYRRDDGKLAALVQVIQTRSKACNASLRFFREVQFACIVAGSDCEMLQRPLTDEDDDPSIVKSEGDRVSIKLPSHGVAELMVVFQ